jgi:hypothetical protein
MIVSLNPLTGRTQFALPGAAAVLAVAVTVSDDMRGQGDRRDTQIAESECLLND